jgi:hypothetical protein
MPVSKPKTSQYQQMFQKNTESAQSQKLFIESLIKKLNEKLQNNPKLAVKAARIIEDWINQPPKKRK